MTPRRDFIAPGHQRLRPTRAFAFVLGITVLALFFFWAGVGPLGFLAGAGLVLLVLAPLLARLQLSGIRVQPPAPVSASAGAWMRLPLTLSNRGLCTARDLLVTVDEGNVRTVAPTAYVPSLAAGGEAEISTAPRFVERGRRSVVRVAVTSSFPFRLMDRQLVFELPADILILPWLGALRALDERVAYLGGANHHADAGRGGDGEFYGLREWREGESMRGVHWKLSARRGRVLLRELRSEDRPALRIFLSTFVRPSPRARRTTQRGHGSFERAVCLAATIAEHFLRRGHRVGLTLVGPEFEVFDAARGRAGLYPVLARLAEVQPTEGEPLEGCATLGSAEDRELPVIVFAGGGAPARVEGHRRERALFLDVDGPDIDEVFDPTRPHYAPLPASGVSRPRVPA